MRLSIEITPEQHKRLKATAALQGKTIKEYVLEKTLPTESEEAALQGLENFMKPRVEAAQKGEFASKSVQEIFEEVATNKV